MTPIIRCWVIHLREKCALKVLYAYIHKSFFIFIFRFPDSSLDYYTITVNLIHKKVVCFNSWTISIRVHTTITDNNGLSVSTCETLFFIRRRYILWFFQFTGFILLHAPTQKRYLTIHNYFFSNLLTPFILSRSQLKAEIAVV